MSKKRETAKNNIKLFFKSAALTAIALLLVAIGFIAARFFLGG